MTNTSKSASISVKGIQWTGKRTAVLLAACLLVGLVGGRLIRSAQASSASSSTTSTTVAPAGKSALPDAPPANPAQSIPAQSIPAPSSPIQLKGMADAEAAPQLEKLKSEPRNPDLLTSIGNVYYDAHQYPIAIDYYLRVLSIKPANAAVRTDMATAQWYMGNADAAITEFNRALAYEPTNPNTLFNRGLVKWKGKADTAGAITDWEKLLAANPNYDARDNVKQMIAEAKKQQALKP